MINKKQVYEIILSACPSFRPKFEDFDDKELQYSVMGELARHLLELYNNNDTQEFSTLCKEIDRLIVEGNQYVKELAVIGILEGI